MCARLKTGNQLRVDPLGLVADMGEARGRISIALDPTTRQRMALHVRGWPLEYNQSAYPAPVPSTSGPWGCLHRQGSYLLTMS